MYKIIKKFILNLPLFLGGFSAVEATVHVFPEAGRVPYTEIIRSAKKELLVMAYVIDDRFILAELEKSAKRGVSIKILLEENKFSHEKSASSSVDLQNIHKNISVHLTPKSLNQLHAKFFIADRKKALISTGNLDRESFSGFSDVPPTRDFAFETGQVEIVSPLIDLFENDWAGECRESHSTSLVLIAPQGYRQGLKKFLNEAKQSIDLYQQDITDPEILALLLKKIEKGLKVTLVMTPFPFGGKVDHNAAIQEKIERAGGRVILKNYPYMHSKIVILDGGTENARALLGSSNFYKPSLNKNREAGVIISEPKALQVLMHTFQYDAGLEH